MRTTITTLALLAILMQVTLGGLGGKLCVRMAPLPQSSGCETGCCDEAQPQQQVSSQFNLLNDDGLPIDSDCCVEIDANILMTVVDHGQRIDVDEIATPHYTPRVDTLVLAPTVATSWSGRSTHPPPSLLMVRSTVLRI